MLQKAPPTSSPDNRSSTILVHESKYRILPPKGSQSKGYASGGTLQGTGGSKRQRQMDGGDRRDEFDRGEDCAQCILRIGWCHLYIIVDINLRTWANNSLSDLPGSPEYDIKR